MPDYKFSQVKPCSVATWMPLFIVTSNDEDQTEKWREQVKQTVLCQADLEQVLFHLLFKLWRKSETVFDDQHSEEVRKLDKTGDQRWNVVLNKNNGSQLLSHSHLEKLWYCLSSAYFSPLLVSSRAAFWNNPSAASSFNLVQNFRLFTFC